VKATVVRLGHGNKNLRALSNNSEVRRHQPKSPYEPIDLERMLHGENCHEKIVSEECVYKKNLAFADILPGEGYAHGVGAISEIGH